MSTYRKIHGRSIQAVTTDPSESVAEGQIWYNTTSDTFKSVLVSAAWSSASPTINLTNNGAGAGAQTASLTFGGRNPPGPAFVATTEEYGGLGWTAGGALNTARSYLAGFGTQTAAVAAGGRIDAPGTSTNATEEYNGSSWTTVNNMGTARRVGGDAGIVQTAGLAIGGGPPGVTTTEHYDGTNWTSGGALNTARFYLAGFGTLTSAVAAGGNGGESAVEEYNGSSWTSATSLGTGRTQLGSSGSSETDGIVFGGEAPGPTVKADAESYDGTSWTEGPNLATARRGLSGSSGHSKTAALATAGFPTYNLTEEFNSSANVITAAAWSSGSNFPGPASSVRGFGTVHSASVAIGGETGPGPTVSSCYSYDGSSWTSVPAIPNTARNVFAYGTQTAGLYSGGNTQPGQTPISNASAEWDGSGWTGGPTVPTSRGFGASSGVQTSALSTAGDQGGSPFAATAVDSYNGSTWTSETAYPGGAYGMTGCGRSETTAFVFGGEAPYPGSNANVATYNGSAWTTTATPVNTILPANSQQASSYGEQDDCIGFGGTSSQSATAGWDGTAWSTRPNMGTGRSAGGTGISTDALAFCGSPVPNGGNKTEEFIGETSALNVKTLTQS
jgi:hypothetical protein